MNAKRRRLVIGTERIWGICVFSLGLALGTVITFALSPSFFTGGEVNPSARVVYDFVVRNIVVLTLAFVAACALVLRYHLWQPIARLYRDAETPGAFWAHCRAVARASLPYGVLAGLAIGQLMLPFSGYAIFAQFAVLFAVDQFVDRRRDKWIANDVKGLMGRPAT